jgi:hypothetical protein
LFLACGVLAAPFAGHQVRRGLEVARRTLQNWLPLGLADDVRQRCRRALCQITVWNRTARTDSRTSLDASALVLHPGHHDMCPCLPSATRSRPQHGPVICLVGRVDPVRGLAIDLPLGPHRQTHACAGRADAEPDLSQSRVGLGGACPQTAPEAAARLSPDWLVRFRGRRG